MPTIQLQFRRGTSTEWSNANPTLAAGEMGIETNTSQFKVGDGTTAWVDLSYGGIQGPTGLAGSVSNLQNGTVAAPSLAFATDLSSGLYSPSSGNVSFATAGIERIRIGSSVNMPSGSVSAPSLAFITDVSSGMYLPSSGNVSFATAGIERVRVGSNVTIPTPMRARILTSNISGTSATVDFTSTDGTYYFMTNTGFNALTLTFPGSNNAPGAFNVFRNTTGTNMSVTLTYSGGGSGITSPLTISSSNSATIVWSGTTYVLF